MHFCKINLAKIERKETEVSHRNTDKMLTSKYKEILPKRKGIE